ncbi:MAG: hypothetical protein ACOZD0_04645 [Pseudomonadota bacterium]
MPDITPAPLSPDQANVEPPSAAALHRMYLELAQRVGKVECLLDENNRVTCQVHRDTRDLVEAFGNLKGGLRVLEGMGKLARPVAYIGAAVSAVLGVWAAWKADGK